MNRRGPAQLIALVLAGVVAASSAACTIGSSESAPPTSATARPSAESQAASGLGLPTSAPLVGPAPGDFKRINLASGRAFILHVPADYDASTAWPLVMAFHGWKQSATDMYGYSELASAEAITVFPDGKNGAWAPAPYATTSGDEDVAFIRDIVDAVRATYSIDDQRIHATGLSNGGGFAAYLACQMPEVFHSVASVSAAYYETIHQGCADTPVGRLDLHGTYDPIVDYYGGTRHGMKYQPVPEVLAADARRNKCTSEIDTLRLANNALQQTWVGCAAPLQHIRIGGGKHVWPGGHADDTSEVGTGFATDKVLDFFGIPGRPKGTQDT